MIMLCKILIGVLLLNQVLLIFSLCTPPLINNRQLAKSVVDFHRDNTPDSYQKLLESRANVESRTAKERVVYLVANVVNALIIRTLVRKVKRTKSKSPL